MGVTSVEMAALQFPPIAAARLAGYSVHVIIPTPSPALEDLYRKMGAVEFVYLLDALGPGLHPETARLMAGLASVKDLLELTYKSLFVGKFVLSTLMRKTRRGEFDLSDGATRLQINAALSQSLKYTDCAYKTIRSLRPSLAAFYDRGYSPDGEFFSAAINKNVPAMTMNSAHRGGMMMFKRYNQTNADRHHATMAPSTWENLRSFPFSDSNWNEAKTELVDAYTKGEWYDDVGTQFDRSSITGPELAKHLDLDPNKKIAVLFVHMFWDATFFWGEDLFDGYEDWFVQSLKSMAKNDEVNWIIKLHPANKVKAQRDGFKGRDVEYDAIERAIGELPAHIKVLPADTGISTLSLFESIDYCVTVRGTVGIEAASLGIPVITAGTGRYDGLGFTVDHGSREDYLVTLENIVDVPAMSEKALDLARRYIWGLLYTRPLRYDSVRYYFERNSTATLNVTLNDNALQSPETMPDIIRLREWLENPKEDIVTGMPNSV